MLHVILLILKILGIILLVAAGLLLAALYAVLFVGVSYRIRAVREEKFWAEASASWLFGVLRIRFFLEEGSVQGPVLQVRFFGRLSGRKGDVRRHRRWWKFWKKKKQTGASSASKDAALTKESGEKESSGQKNANVRLDEAHQEQKKSKTAERTVPPPGPPKGTRPQSGSVPLGILQKTVSLVRRLKKKLRGLWESISRIHIRIRKLSERKDTLMEFWKLEEHQRARSAVWKELRYLWKHSRPKKIKGQIRFGFSDPSYTGLCMGAAGMFCAWYPRTLAVIPDFEQKILKCDILIRGKVRCCVFACILWRIYFNKDIRHMYQHWQEL